MNPKLKIVTGNKQEDAGAGEPVSPTGQYFNSNVLCVSTLAVLESEAPIKVPLAMQLLQGVFLPCNPRLSSIMVFDKKGVKHWKRVEVNVEDHCHVPSFPEGSSMMKSYDDYFDEFVTKISTEPFLQDKPLWEVYIINYPTSKAAGQILFKLNHAIGDGYSLMGVLLSCMRRADNPSIPLTFPSIRARSETMSNNNNVIMGAINWAPRTLSAMFNGACDFGWSFLKSTLIADDKTPIRSGNEGLGLHPLEMSTFTLSLDHIKLIKTKLGTTVNDVVAGIIFMGIRLYMEETDTDFGNSRSTALTLFNTRYIRDYKPFEEMVKSQTKSWGNHIAFLHTALPVKCSNPFGYIYETQKQIKRMKTSPSVYLNAQCLEMIRKFRGTEAAAEHMHATMHKSSFIITNIIGPVEQMGIAGLPVKGIYFMALGCPQSLVITIMSYMQTLRIGVGVEKGFIDSQRLNSCIKSAFESTYEAAMKSE